jgi:hypothetical protein
VGLFLQGNRKAQAQLRCVAATTGGKYYPADNTTALTKRLTTVSQRAVQRFQAAGTAVAGGAAATQATPIEQGTDYVDDIRPGEARFYSFPAGTGQVVASTLTEDGSTEYGCCLKLSVLDPSYNSVAYSNLYNSDGTAHSMRAASDNQGVADAGSYVLEVALSDDSAKRPVRYQFKVEVTGTALESTSPSPSASDRRPVRRRHRREHPAVDRAGRVVRARPGGGRRSRSRPGPAARPRRGSHAMRHPR